MELGIRLCLLALVACAAALVIRGSNPHGALMLSCAVCLVVMAQLIPAFRAVWQYGERLVEATALGGAAFGPLVRTVTLAICVRVTAELCRDSGQRAVAAQVEMAGAVIGLLCALPLVEQALGLIGAL